MRNEYIDKQDENKINNIINNSIINGEKSRKIKIIKKKYSPHQQRQKMV